jgi:hypothetical protein
MAEHGTEKESADGDKFQKGLSLIGDNTYPKKQGKHHAYYKDDDGPNAAGCLHENGG